MLGTGLVIITRHFKRNISFHPKTKILSSKNVIILNQAFLHTAVEVPNSTKVRPEIMSRGSYYRQYLLRNSAYKNYLFKVGNTNYKVTTLLNQLQQENENNLNVKNELAEYLEKEMLNFGFNEFCQVLFTVNHFMYNQPQDPLWGKITELLNNECWNRISSWSTDEIVKMTDAVVHLKQSIGPLRKLYFKLIGPKLNDHQTVLLFYFLQKKKFFIPKEYQFDLQQRIIEFLPKLNSTELGIIADGFLKTFTSVRNYDVVSSILKKASEDIDSMDEIPFNSICRFAAALTKKTHFDVVVEFQEKAIDTACKFGGKSIINLALSGEKHTYLHPNLRTKLIKEVKDDIKEISDYYIERVTHLTAAFNIQDDEFLKLAVDEFQRREFSLPKGRTLVQFLNCLTHYKIYPKKLLDLIMQQNYIDRLLGLSQVHNWWQIYCTLEIEKPEYKTFELNPKSKKKINQLSKIHFDKKHPRQYTFLWRIKETLKELFGEDLVNNFIPLPHYPKGLLMRFDKTLKPQKLPSDFNHIRKGSIVEPLKDDHIWMFFIVGYPPYVTDCSGVLPCLFFQTHLRQLSAVGYVPILVHNNYTLQKEYFENLINSKLEEVARIK